MHEMPWPRTGQISLILEPVSMGLGFTVLPAYAVDAFQHFELVRSHRLPNPVSETLYLGVQRQKALQRRMQTVIVEAQKWL
ncbi:MAG: DNA-binding transcriptional LysR family regulator [Halopseudomonas sp.]|jgi:DNA-binding transcriptional LysR family regulator|uniref:LysR substrate-binding domain-containing protein n=1 Tax=Halopseudomonas sp. TaxID=2901191 RepID=UPI0039E37F66